MPLQHPDSQVVGDSGNVAAACFGEGSGSLSLRILVCIWPMPVAVLSSVCTVACMQSLCHTAATLNQHACRAHMLAGVGHDSWVAKAHI